MVNEPCLSTASESTGEPNSFFNNSDSGIQQSSALNESHVISSTDRLMAEATDIMDKMELLDAQYKKLLATKEAQSKDLETLNSTCKKQRIKIDSLKALLVEKDNAESRATNAELEATIAREKIAELENKLKAKEKDNQMEKDNQSSPPHVLVFPLPIQGHINPMIKLAELLALAGFKLTFLNSHNNHERLLKFTNIAAHFARYPGFEFETITDSLPRDHPRTGDWILETFKEDKQMKIKRSLREMLLNITPRVDCIIGDGFLGHLIIDVAKELGIPIFCLRTSSPCSVWAYYCIPDMIQAGELPIKGCDDMDRFITMVSGMETYLRCRDLPSCCRATNMEDAFIKFVAEVTRKIPQANALILNTTEELDGIILSQIRTICPDVYAIGPINAQLNSRLNVKHGEMDDRFSHSTLWEVDASCISWLDKQPNRSVIYACFGSITSLSREQLLELWYGLVNSNTKFLFVVRQNSVIGKDDEMDDVIEELLENAKDRGYIVDWAPQEAILNHPTVGGFLTHSGWNSTLESIVAGVPMICWSYFADQEVTSRVVSEVWKIGLDMKDVCDRRMVEKMVNGLMVDRKEEFAKSATELAKLTNQSVSVGGSSYSNLDRLIKDIRRMSLKTPRK